MHRRFLEDFAVGQVFQTGRLRVEKEAIFAFARQFDPQPFHLDEDAALRSPFQGLAASGWHTAAMTMRLLVDGEFRPAGGILGVGFDELSWPRAVRPGDELHAQSEVLEVRPSKSRHVRGDPCSNHDLQPEQRSRTGLYRESPGTAPPRRGIRSIVLTLSV